MSAEDDWGPLTLRSVIENMEDVAERVWCGYEKRALVDCSLDCGKNLREIARIQRKHHYVLLASHERMLPDGKC